MFKSLFSFEGRIRRLEYGLSYLIYILLYATAALIWQEFQQGGTIIFLFYVAFLWFILAQGAKRCHDLGNNGFFQLIPFYGLWLIFQDGELNENQYGLNPKGKSPTHTIPLSERSSLLNMLVEVSSTVLLNTLFIAFSIEYLYTTEIALFLWMIFSVIACYFLMLLVNYRGISLPDNRNVVLKLPILYAVILYICIRLYTLNFRGIEIYIQTIYFEIFIAALLMAFTYIPYFGYKMLFKIKVKKAMNPRYHLIASGVLIVCILMFGFTHKAGSGNKEMITWSETALTWEDFEPVNHVLDGFDASINSSVSCPNLITEGNSRVFAYMNPNESEKQKNEELTEQLLVHEQYHFNITEYCARLLRKDIVEKGLGGLSLKTIKTLKTKYSEKLEDLQNLYDSISDHNGNWKEQRQWELKIDDWLRQTAYYKKEDVYDYYDFTKNRTRFFRHIFFTFTHKVLTSYPVGEKDIKYGETYEILYITPREKVVKFYKDGKLVNGGYFETAVTKIIKKEKGFFEVHYLNADETYNQNLTTCIKKTFDDEKNNRIVSYFNHEKKRVEKNSIYETRWKFNSDNQYYYSTYLNKAGRAIADDNGIYHEKRVLDSNERTILIENFDSRNRLKNNSKFIARRQFEFSKDNRKVKYQLYDENGSFAYHLSDYNLSYNHDERGNIIRVTSLDENDKNTYDDNGASIYEFTYDLFDRETQIKRFNSDHLPIVANDDFFKQVKEYDSLGRIQFEAYYYPDHVLKYSDTFWGATKYGYENGSIVKEYNTDGHGDLIQNDNKVAIIKKRLNKEKEIISETYFGIDENFAKMEDGVVEYRYKHNDKGKTIETAVYDSIGKLKDFEADVAIVRWDYDDYGNKSKTSYFNTENQLAHTADGVTYNIYKYSKDGKLLERSNYDVNMKPTLFDGAFKTQFTLNKVGLDSIQYEYDANGKLKRGVAITKFYYNKYNNRIRTEYFNSANRRGENSEGVSATNVIYNKRQYRIGYEYFDERNQYTNNHSGVSFEKWELDELGHTKAFRYFDKNSKPVVGPTGYHKIEHEWAAVGETSRTAIYDADLSLIEDEYGTAIYEYILEPSGMYSKIKRYNKQGELSENTLGVAITEIHLLP